MLIDGALEEHWETYVVRSDSMGAEIGYLNPDDLDSYQMANSAIIYDVEKITGHAVTNHPLRYTFGPKLENFCST